MKLKNCKRCSLSKTRTQVVTGNGNKRAKIFVIGEAPGKNEDEKGIPFCGSSGKLLDKLLEEAGLNREDIYITNIVKCRPPDNRDPDEEEINTCKKWLVKEIERAEPRIIITLGKFAGEFISEETGLSFTRIGRVHGTIKKAILYGQGAYVVRMYHPAAGLYRPNMKELLFEDFKHIQKLVRYVK